MRISLLKPENRTSYAKCWEQTAATYDKSPGTTGVRLFQGEKCVIHIDKSEERREHVRDGPANLLHDALEKSIEKRPIQNKNQQTKKECWFFVWKTFANFVKNKTALTVYFIPFFFCSHLRKLRPINYFSLKIMLLIISCLIVFIILFCKKCLFNLIDIKTSKSNNI